MRVHRVSRGVGRVVWGGGEHMGVQGLGQVEGAKERAGKGGGFLIPTSARCVTSTMVKMKPFHISRASRLSACKGNTRYWGKTQSAGVREAEAMQGKRTFNFTSCPLSFRLSPTPSLLAWGPLRR